MKKNQLIQYKIKITTQTPLHIGSGEGEIKNYQYIYNNRTQTISFIDEHKWIQLISKKRLWKQYTDYAIHVSTNKHPQSLFNWITTNKITDQEIRSVTRGTVQAYVQSDQKTSLNDIYPLITHPDGTLCIPGSTIKGFVRTAILHHLIAKNKTQYQREWNELKQAISFDKRNINKIFNRVEAKALQTLQNIKTNIQNANPRNKAENVLTADVMRGILISDAIATQPRSQTPTILVQKIDVSPDSLNEKPLPIFRECIAPNTELHATITLDTSMTQTIGITNIDQLKTILNTYLDFAYAKQKTIFQQQYQNTFQMINNADLILGAGTGFHTKTLIRTLAPTEDEARKTIMEWMKTTFRQHKHEKDKNISPRTLKITRYRGQAELMGLCAITEE